MRNLELMWLTGRLAPDFKTIADFRRDNGRAIRRVCSQFVALCRRSGLFSEAVVAIDGSKFKAVNHRDKNFTEHKLKVRLEHLEQSVGQYLAELDRADREPVSVPEVRIAHLKEKIGAIRTEIERLEWDRRTAAASARWADFIDRSGCPLDGERRPWHRHRRLQRADGGGGQTPPDRCP